MKKLAFILMFAVLTAAASVSFAVGDIELQTAAAPTVDCSGIKVQQVTGKLENADVSTVPEACKPEQDTAQQVRYYQEIPLDAELQQVLFDCCDEYDIPYAVALGLIQTESQFQPFAVNAESGCYGLCQLNPEYFPSGLCPADNIRHGMRYLAGRIDYYGGDITSGLQAYKNYLDNGGRYYPNTILAYAAEWERIL